MDGSEGQRFLHARSANEIENDDEHWLWAHVDRIKRSIESVLGSGNGHPNKRMKRDLFDWPSWGSDDAESDTTTETPTTQAPSTAAPLENFFGSLFGSNEKSTTIPPRIDSRYHQIDRDTEGETTTEDIDIDIDNEAEEGSGSSRDYVPREIESPFCRLHMCIFCFL